MCYKSIFSPLISQPNSLYEISIFSIKHSLSVGLGVECMIVPGSTSHPKDSRSPQLAVFHKPVAISI